MNLYLANKNDDEISSELSFLLGRLFLKYRKIDEAISYLDKFLPDE